MGTNLRRQPNSAAGDNPLPDIKIPPSYHLDDDINSNCSTPYVSAPSSPARPFSAGFCYSAPTSPSHYAYSSVPAGGLAPSVSDASSIGSFEFVFSDRLDSPEVEIGSVKMSCADELFLNGQIRPMKLSTANLHRPRPVLDVGGELERETHQNETFRFSRVSRFGDRSQRRRARSLSPLRNTTPFNAGVSKEKLIEEEEPETPATGRSSRRWDFLKDFLRSKSEGRKSAAEKVRRMRKEIPAKKTTAPVKRRSAHEVHYAAKKAQEEEKRKKTYLPYKQGVLGCLGFNSKSYGAINVFARSLNPVSST